MRYRSLLLVAALALGCPAAASADIHWLDPVWTVTPTVTGASPPTATGSVSSSSVSADTLTLFLSAYAENPPGPGRPSVTVRAQVTRRFRVVGPTMTVALQAPISGSLTVGSAGGTTDANLSVRFDVFSTEDINIFRTYSAPATISESPADSGRFFSGDYTIRGDIELTAFSQSGGPFAMGDVEVGVVLSPVPQPVPEPGAYALLTCGVIARLRAARPRR